MNVIEKEERPRRRRVMCKVCKYMIRPNSQCAYVLVGDQRKYGCRKCFESGVFEAYVEEAIKFEWPRGTVSDVIRPRYALAV